MATLNDECDNNMELARMPLWQKELIQRRKHVSKVIANNVMESEQQHDVEGKNDNNFF